MDRILGSWGETRTVPLVCSLPSLCQRPPTHLRAFTLVHVLLASSSFFFVVVFCFITIFSIIVHTHCCNLHIPAFLMRVLVSSQGCEVAQVCDWETAHGCLLQDYWGRMALFALGGNVAVRTYFWWRHMKERQRFQDIGVNQKMILKRIL